MVRCALIVMLFICAQSVSAADLVKETEHPVLYVTQGEFADVKETLELAITDQGLVINNVADIASMLDKTGADLGDDEQLYTHGLVFDFCSATLSREKMKADRSNIVFCPFTMQAYELPEEPGSIYVGYRRPPVVGNEQSQAALQKIDDLLRTILDEALSW